jgi:transcriptional regulatory protein LEU3
LSTASDSDIGAAARNSLQELHLTMMSMSDQLSPTTPGNGNGLPAQGFATSPPTQQRGFKRSASSEDDDFANGDAEGSRPASARRNIAVKRACNECRQQKVRPSRCAGN